MNNVEKLIVFAAIASQAVFISEGLLRINGVLGYGSSPLAPYVPVLFLVSFAALIITIADLYKRQFTNPNRKITWLLIIMLTGGVGWLVYIFKHAIKPRDTRQNA